MQKTLELLSEQGFKRNGVVYNLNTWFMETDMFVDLGQEPEIAVIRRVILEHALKSNASRFLPLFVKIILDAEQPDKVIDYLCQGFLIKKTGTFKIYCIPLLNYEEFGKRLLENETKDWNDYIIFERLKDFYA